MRVCIGGSSYDWYGAGAGGVAYLDSFIWETDTPCFVFTAQLGNGNTKYTAEATSHEVGHTFNLIHDGQVANGTSAAVGYYQGHANWAPIMGVGYYKDVTQWSKGEYPYANNLQDDVAIIAGFTGYRVDQHGDTILNATALTGTSVSTSGIIERRTDADIFSFTTGTGTVSFSAVPAAPSPNLDIQLALYDGVGNLVTSANPATLDVTLTAALTQGTYYLAVDGIGTGNAFTAYNDYSSLGTFSLSGNVVPVNPEIRVRGNGLEIANNDATPSTQDHTSFGQVTTSGGWIERIFTIDNIGSGDLRLTGSPPVVISGSGAPQFSVQALPSATISPGRSSTFALRFRPTSNGTFAAMVSLTNTDGDENPTTFAINGSANIPTRDDLPNSFPGRTVDRISNTPAALNHAGDEDFVTFVMPWTRTVVMETLGSTDTAGALLDSSGRVLANDSSSGSGGNFRIQRVLGAGTYHLRIQGQTSSTVGSYIISLH